MFGFLKKKSELKRSVITFYRKGFRDTTYVVKATQEELNTISEVLERSNINFIVS